MRTKYPIEYELNPTKVDRGTHWLTLKLKNIGSETLKELDVQLHSLIPLLFTFLFMEQDTTSQILSQVKR